MTERKEPAIERAVIETLRELQGESEDDLIAQLVSIFTEHTPKRLQQMRDARGASDPAGVAREAHSLKSSSANLGARELARVCREVEERGRSGSLDGIDELLAKLEEEYTRAAVELKIIAKAGQAR